MTKYSEELQISLEAARAGAKIVSENYGKFQVSNTKENAKGLVTQTVPSMPLSVPETPSGILQRELLLHRKPGIFLQIGRARHGKEGKITY